MHARLLLSQDIFSFEKKPTICGLERGGKEAEAEARAFEGRGWDSLGLASGSGADSAGVGDAGCVSESGGVYTRRK
jgi:hypothetical protein